MGSNKDRILSDIIAVRNGDSVACAALFAAYRPLIESLVAGVASRVHADEAEMQSEAEFALYRAALSYDVTQAEITFGLYAKVCVSNHLISKFIRKKNVSVSLSLDELGSNGYLDALSFANDDGDSADTISDTDSLRLLYRKIRSVLSDYEMSVFRLWVEEYSAKDIAARLGRDEKSVSNAVNRSLSKLRAALH